ncbi:GGDEF domain-containing protein [Bradyrhizobium prioriisuperbiae]|uniref:GGDEF domain-containing protein n=1 Tax=Bradyrhizobium prioriisuperbiae TaxID=2854389 RepID=UPI0028EEECBD|nr:GGDEF domain-containing protein [Bradyrhizobium prioritasuperba]
MSQQAPVLCISDGANAWSKALSGVGSFPLVDTAWKNAARAIDRLQPAAVLVADADAADERLGEIAAQVADIQPYIPLIAINLKTQGQASNAISFSAADGNLVRLEARLTAALRVRTLHATVLRRIIDTASMQQQLPNTDPLDDATVLLIGRGASYPTLSIALGERMGVVGALSIEAAAKHLNTRDLDGVVIGEGFSHRVIDAFLTVLSEDSRFRDLPAILTGSAAAFVSVQSLPNLEIVSGQAEDVASSAIPLIRQHAFAARLTRALKSLDAGGLLDTRTGLMTSTAFDRDFALAIEDAQKRGGGLSAARFMFGSIPDRIRYDAARILSRLMRRMDFAALQDDGSIVVAFAETDLRTAHMIARRLASVLRHTMHSLAREKRIDPHVTLVTLLPKDSAVTLFDRLYGESQRAAS